MISYALRDAVAWITMESGDQGNPINPAWGEQMFAAGRRARADTGQGLVLRELD